MSRGTRRLIDAFFAIILAILFAAAMLGGYFRQPPPCADGTTAIRGGDKVGCQETFGAT